MKNRPDINELTAGEFKNSYMELWEDRQIWKQMAEQFKKELDAIKNKPQKDSTNSSNPPSDDQKPNLDPKKDPDDKKPRKRHSNGGRKFHENPDKIEDLYASHCPHCEAPVEQGTQSLKDQFENVEIPEKINPTVTLFNQYGGTCSCCQKKYMAPLPTGVDSKSLFGPNVQKHLIYMRYNHHISYNRLITYMLTTFGVEISPGSLAQIFKRSHCKLLKIYEMIGEQVKESDLICSDETSARVKGKNHWEWVFQNIKACFHIIAPSRGSIVIEDFLKGNVPLTWISDLYSGQLKNPALKLQICLAHQLRNCKYAVDCKDEIFAPVMIELILEGIVLGKQYQKIPSSEYETKVQAVLEKLTKALTLNPTKKEGIRLHKRYTKHKDSIFLFLEDPSKIPPTNNSSEQAIRMSVIFRKITNGFRVEWGGQFFAVIRSIVNTGARRGYDAYNAISKALDSPDAFFPSTA